MTVIELNKENMPQLCNLYLYTGDTYDEILTFTDSDGNPLTLLDGVWEGKADIRNSGLLVKALELTMLDEGQVRVYLSEEDAEDLLPGVYSWDLQLKDPDDKVRTYLRGQVVVMGEVTLNI